mgnify:CR=1 FL=1
MGQDSGTYDAQGNEQKTNNPFESQTGFSMSPDD